MNVGEDNPAYKGEDAGYGAIHAWVRRRKPKPKVCERCENPAKLDLANKSGEYSRDLSDWEYICRKCHMSGDGRIEGLKELAELQRLPDFECEYCHCSFETKDSRQRFCSQKCFGASRRKRT